MIVLGLTGSVGMGKSWAAGVFARLGATVYEADGEVRKLLGPGGDAVRAVGEAFPGTIRGGTGGPEIDRRRLGEIVFADRTALSRLEVLLHPLVRQAEGRFLRRAARRRSRVVVLEVPLLFETGSERRCDLTAVVMAPAFVQAARVLRRPGMTPARLAAVRARQMADGDKRRRADFVIPTGAGPRPALRVISRMVRMLEDSGAARQRRPRRRGE
ncbi:MAG: dephospho-CoA kinase [Alphaproteobacteria bacterium]